MGALTYRCEDHQKYYNWVGTAATVVSVVARQGDIADRGCRVNNADRRQRLSRSGPIVRSGAERLNSRHYMFIIILCIVAIIGWWCIGLAIEDVLILSCRN